MRCIVNGFIGLFVGTLIAAAANAQPAVNFEVKTYDFGDVVVGQVLNYNFVYTNKGNQPLEIIKTSTSCSCTAANLSEKTLPAGATGAISVTTTVKGPGAVTQQAIIQTNDPKNPQVTLMLRGTARQIWDFSPQSSFNFTGVSVLTQATSQLFLKNLDGKPFKITGIKVSKPEFFKVNIGDPTNGLIPISVTFTADKKKGLMQDVLEIRTDYTVNPVATANILADVVGYVQFSRSQIYFGMVEPGKEIEREVTISLAKSINAKDFEIKKILSDKGDVTGKILYTTPQNEVQVQLKFKAPSTTGYLSGKVEFQTNLEIEPTAQISYSALVRNRSAQ